jgi:hypothetical protein
MGVVQDLLEQVDPIKALLFAALITSNPDNKMVGNLYPLIFARCFCNAPALRVKPNSTKFHLKYSGTATQILSLMLLRLRLIYMQKIIYKNKAITLYNDKTIELDFNSSIQCTNTIQPRRMAQTHGHLEKLLAPVKRGTHVAYHVKG